MGNPSPSASGHEQRHDSNDEEQEEQYLRDACSTRRDAAEAEQRRNQRNDEKYDGVMEHVDLPDRLAAFSQCLQPFRHYTDHGMSQCLQPFRHCTDHAMSGVTLFCHAISDLAHDCGMQ
jgi:hypothetical protein